MSDSTAEVAALQDVLGGEQAAVYVLGVLGAQTSQSKEPGLFARLTAAFVAHRDRRDALTATITGLGATAVAAQPAYQVPADLSSAARVQAAALRIEQSCAATYAYGIANTSGAERARLITALLDAADREIGFGGAPQLLPGL